MYCVGLCCDNGAGVHNSSFISYLCDSSSSERNIAQIPVPPSLPNISLAIRTMFRGAARPNGAVIEVDWLRAEARHSHPVLIEMQ